MNKLLLLALLLTRMGVLCAQETPLPIFKGGKWGIIHEGKTIDLEKKYAYVHYFDACGLTWVQAGKYYGVIDDQGRELIRPQYYDLEAMGEGVFQARSDSGLFLLVYRGDEFRIRPVKQINDLGANWKQIRTNQGWGYYNTASDSLFYPDSLWKVQFNFNFLILTNTMTGVHRIHGHQGELLWFGNGEVDTHWNYIRLDDQVDEWLLDENGAWQFPTASTHRRVNSEYLGYALKGKAWLFSRATRQLIYTYPADELYALAQGYEIVKKERHGLISHEGKELIAPVYDYFILGKPFVLLLQNGLQGLMDTLYKPLLPCKYGRITWDESFFYTTSFSGQVGLYSRKYRHEILPAEYDLLEFKNGMIKARLGNNLSLLSLTEKHQLRDKVSLGNVISVGLRKGSVRSPQLDPRLAALGWFLDSTEQKGAKSFRYGIRNQRDSIILKPRYPNMYYIPNSNFSLYKENLSEGQQGVLQSKVGIEKQITSVNFVLIDYLTGRRFYKLPILLHIDTLDLLSRSYSRFVDTASYGIIDANNQIRRFDYLDLEQANYVRYCTASQEKKYATNAAAPGFVPFQRNLLNRKYETHFKNRQLLAKLSQHEGHPKGMQYPGAQWNFLTPEGDSLFAEPFTFAHPYYKQTAIVQRKSGWGIVRNDSIVVALQYSSVKRMGNFEDTCFLLGLSKGSQVFYDSNLRIRPMDGFAFVKQHGKLLEMQKGRIHAVMDLDGKILIETEKHIRFHAFDRYVLKEKKMFVIHDDRGAVLGEVPMKPETFLQPGVFTFEHAGKLGLADVYGDTILPPVWKTIVPFDGGWRCESSLVNALAPSEGISRGAKAHWIQKTNAEILVDSITGAYAIHQKGKLLVYAQNETKARKLKTEGVPYTCFYNGCFFASKSDFVLSTSGQKIPLHERIKHIEGLPEGICIGQKADDTWLIFDDQWKTLAAHIPNIRSVDYLGQGVLQLHTQTGMVLYQIKTNKSTEAFCEVKANPDQGGFLVRYNQGYSPWVFVDEHFEVQSKWQFSKAHPYQGNLAPVADARGWTLISADGTQQAYPNFQELQFLGPNLIMSKAKTLYGISDSHGRLLIDVAYEDLQFISADVIRGVRDGQLFYFDRSGKIIFE